MEAQATTIEVADTVPPSAPRRAKKTRAALDDYPTPRPMVDAILPHLPLSGNVLDPACGAGVLLQAVKTKCPSAKAYGIDISGERLSDFKAQTLYCGAAHGDALAGGWARVIDVYGNATIDTVIMNPPFSHATQFAARALAEVAPGGTVAMLARLTFLESAERYREVFAKHGSPDVYVFSKRPQFRAGEKGTDSATCAWFVWGPGRAGRLVVLPPSATTGER